MAETKHATVDARMATFEYDAFTDVLTVHLDGARTDSVEDAPHGVLVHYSADGAPVAIEIIGFSTRRAIHGDPPMLTIDLEDPLDVLLPARIAQLLG